MLNKYKVSEVAKDFGLKSKDIIDLLAKYFEGEKKHSSALEEDELDIVFETFTLAKQVDEEGLKSYFDMASEKKSEEKKPEKAEEKQEAPAEEKQEKKQEESKKEQPAKQEKPVQTKKEEKKEDPKASAKPPKKDEVGKFRMPEKKAETAPEKKKENKPTQARTKGEMRTRRWTPFSDFR